MVSASSLKVPRASSYSGSRLLPLPFAYTTLTSYGRSFQYRSARLGLALCGPKPHGARTMVWALPRSLATTCGISVDFSSSSYLDVSVQTVPHVRLFYSTHVDRLFACRVAPFGNLRIDAYVPLPVAYRSLSRPSSAPDAKASSLRPSSLDLRRSRLAPFRFRARLRLPRKLHIRSSAAPLKIKCQAFDFEFLGSLKNSCPRIMQAPLTEVVLIVVFRYPLRLLT